MRVTVLAMTGLLAAFPAIAAEKCMVTDPSGTLLNVRDKPGGKILTTLPNGVILDLGETTKDAKGRTWVRIAALRFDAKAKGGWVAYDLLSCF